MPGGAGKGWKKILRPGRMQFMPGIVEPSRNGIIEWGRAYRDVDFAVCWVLLHQKNPIYRDWTLRSLEPHELYSTQNIGLMGGALSGNRVCVDLDDRRVLELADSYLPQTALEAGRPGKPRSHRWYVATDLRPEDIARPEVAGGIGGPRTRHFDGIDLLGTGAQAVSPPSLWTDPNDHRRKERRRWDRLGEASPIPYGEMLERISSLLKAAGLQTPETQPEITPCEVRSLSNRHTDTHPSESNTVTSYQVGVMSAIPPGVDKLVWDSVLLVVSGCVPRRRGMRQRCLCRMSSGLKAIDSLMSLELRLAAFRLWYEASKGVIREKDPEVSLRSFLGAWDRCDVRPFRRPASARTDTPAAQHTLVWVDGDFGESGEFGYVAGRKDVSDIDVGEGTAREKLYRLLAFLQQEAGPHLFPLTHEMMADRLGIHKQSVKRLVDDAIKRGHLSRPRKGWRGVVNGKQESKCSWYRFLNC
jgi:Bifunctional DNA primase/polymerase, N-terminal